jgi:hypothetical protein
MQALTSASASNWFTRLASAIAAVEKGAASFTTQPISGRSGFHVWQQRDTVRLLSTKMSSQDTGWPPAGYWAGRSRDSPLHPHRDAEFCRCPDQRRVTTVAQSDA